MDNLILRKSYRFAVRITKLCKYLQNSQSEFVLTKQLLRAGTSIGANVTEAQEAQSKADFISKLNIALKESVETSYWLRLLYDSDYLNTREFYSIHNDCKEIIKILTAIIKTAKSA